MNQFEEIKVLKNAGIIAPQSPHAKAVQFLKTCEDLGLNPYRSELFLGKKYDPELGNVFVIFCGINGLNKLAHLSGEYTGCDEPIYTDNDNECTLSVYRSGNKFTSKVTMKEYAPNPLSGTWKQFPLVMLAKVAKSHALRAAFPEKLNGIYIDEEFSNYKDHFVGQVLNTKINNQIDKMMNKLRPDLPGEIIPNK